jgi:hypothetical protein
MDLKNAHKTEWELEGKMGEMLSARRVVRISRACVFIKLLEC